MWGEVDAQQEDGEHSGRSAGARGRGAGYRRELEAQIKGSVAQPFFIIAPSLKFFYVLLNFFNSIYLKK